MSNDIPNIEKHAAYSERMRIRLAVLRDVALQIALSRYKEIDGNKPHRPSLDFVAYESVEDAAALLMGINTYTQNAFNMRHSNIPTANRNLKQYIQHASNEVTTQMHAENYR